MDDPILKGFLLLGSSSIAGDVAHDTKKESIARAQEGIYSSFAFAFAFGLAFGFACDTNAPSPPLPPGFYQISMFLNVVGPFLVRRSA